MAEQSSFFNAIIQNGIPDRTYKAEMFAKFFSSFIGNGVFPNPSTGLQVIAVDNNMTIRVKAGKGWINGYYYENTDDLILQIANADGVLNRIDRIVLNLDFLNREIRIHIKKGVFATNPIPPIIQRDADNFELAIADIKINAGTIQINQSNITDIRLNKDLCGIVTGTIDQVDTTTLYNKLQGYIDERGQDVDAWVTQATETWGIEFTSWFNNIKDILGDDVAGSLAIKIEELESKINNLELTSGKITRPNGKSVEESLSENETSILSLGTDVRELKILVGENNTKLVKYINNTIVLLGGA